VNPLLTALPAAVRLATILAKMAHDEKLMDAGEARSILRGLEETEDRIETANINVAALSHDADSVRDDDANRDNDDD
jgi:hypothetical protein